MTDDVVAELDRWLGTYDADQFWATFPPALVQRARDEIVALRTQLEAVKGIAGNERKLSEAIIRQARDEALEEAAQEAQELFEYGIPAQEFAKRIRALKEEP